MALLALILKKGMLGTGFVFVGSSLLLNDKKRCFAHIVNIAMQHVLAYIAEDYKQRKAESPISRVQDQITHLWASNR